MNVVFNWMDTLLRGIGVSGSWPVVIYAVVIGLAVLIFLALAVLWLIYMERKVMGHMQQRMGPNVTGPLGLLQTVADALKVLQKEDIIPANVDRKMFRLGPVIVFFAAGMLYAVLPFAPGVILSDVNIGILYFVSIASLTALGILSSGWGSNNKYALLGGMRSVAQIVSYEVPLVLSLLGVVMLSGSLSTGEIVRQQSKVWFIVYQPLAFLIYFFAGLAEVNSKPFDLPEGESELIAGFNIEYSGMRFALFYLSEYANLFALSALMATLFLGGWQGPVLPGFVWFLIKTLAMAWVLLWVRATWVRFRIDQVMAFSWKVLLPLSLLNVFITAGEVFLLRGIGG